MLIIGQIWELCNFSISYECIAPNRHIRENGDLTKLVNSIRGIKPIR